MMAPDVVVVGLSEAIQALREQLTSAMYAGWPEGLGFQVEPVELTVQAVVDKDLNGKIGWGVLGVGGSYETATTQTLKLTLTPVWRNSNGTLTKEFTIADKQRTRPKFGPQPDSDADEHRVGEPSPDDSR